MMEESYFVVTVKVSDTLVFALFLTITVMLTIAPGLASLVDGVTVLRTRLKEKKGFDYVLGV